MVGLRLRNLSKRFGDFLAVDNVSLEVAPGELFFILGPSGCGKTTLLRLIAGFYEPDSGRIFFGGRDVTDLAPERRNTGMVFQNYALWPHMNVSQNVAFGLEMRHIPEGERQDRVRKALSMVQMSEYARHLPGQLSGGQQQRIALARALVIEPDIVLLDEPLSNLDAKLRIEMRGQIKQLHKSLALTMVYVTHDQTEALSMADRIAVMHSGRIRQVDTPGELYRRPADTFIAGFIGEANMLEGRCGRDGDKIVVETAAGRLLSAIVGPPVAAGDKIHCCIRPESIRLGGPSAPGDNMLAGTVVGWEYLGSQVQYFVRLCDGSRMKAVCAGRGPELAEGAEVQLFCSPMDVIVLKD
jgi:iron(III) transport system ATP-binding protein